MASITGGVFSKPKGKTGGVVFGSARSRTGKVTTVRALVPPSNPNTAAQQTQRGKFSACQDIVRRLGPSIYQSDFNRAIGQLPGFQSLNSIFLNQMDASENLILTTPVNLGVLHFPDECLVTTGLLAGTIDITPSGENGDNGTSNDLLCCVIIAKTSDGRVAVGGVVSNCLTTREYGGVNITGLVPAAVYEVYVYMRGVGLAAGLLSVANFYEVTAHA